MGNAIYQGMKESCGVLVYDADSSRSLNSLEEVNEQQVVFICVPTPMKHTGEFDLAIVKSCISGLSGGKVLVIKSTITPTAAKELMESFPDQNFVFNPEFLTERTAVQDFQNPTRIVLGGYPEHVSVIERIYKKRFPNTRYIKTDHQTACFIKYFCNCFFACKVSLMNEFKQIADLSGVSWEVAIEGLLSSGWVNQMHTEVPGPDGNLGFGGKCFPKDINAFISHAENVGVEPTNMKAAWKKNLEIRKDKNWLSIKGAVTNGEKNEIK